MTPAAAVRSPACPTASAALQPAASGDWNGWGVSAANDRFQRNPGLTAAQVPQLTVKWAFGFAGDNSAATQPSVVGGRVFVGSGSGRVYDLRSGCTYWMFRADARVRGAVVVGGVRGTQAAFFGDGAAIVYSVDASTGQLRWKRRVDEHRAARITGRQCSTKDGYTCRCPRAKRGPAPPRLTSAVHSAAASSRSTPIPAKWSGRR